MFLELKVLLIFKWNFHCCNCSLQILVPSIMNKEQCILLLFYIFWRQSSWLLFLQNLEFITSVLSGSWDVFEDLSPFIISCAFFWRTNPKARTAFKLGPCCYYEDWKIYWECFLYDNTSWKYQMPPANRRTRMESLQTGSIITCCSGSWRYDISMHTYFHTPTRWGGCQFSENAWEIE